MAKNIDSKALIRFSVITILFTAILSFFYLNYATNDVPFKDYEFNVLNKDIYSHLQSGWSKIHTSGDEKFVKPINNAPTINFDLPDNNSYYLKIFFSSDAILQWNSIKTSITFNSHTDIPLSFAGKNFNGKRKYIVFFIPKQTSAINNIVKFVFDEEKIIDNISFFSFKVQNYIGYNSGFPKFAVVSKDYEYAKNTRNNPANILLFLIYAISIWTTISYIWFKFGNIGITKSFKNTGYSFISVCLILLLIPVIFKLTPYTILFQSNSLVVFTFLLILIINIFHLYSNTIVHRNINRAIYGIITNAGKYTARNILYIFSKNKTLITNRQILFDVLLGTLLLIIPFIVFWQLFISDIHIISGDIFGSGFVPSYFYANSIWENDFPLWNPYLNLGYPQLGDIISASIFYPLDIIQTILFLKWNNIKDFFIIFEIKIIFHLSLGALFMYIFLRNIGGNKLSSLLGSIIFVFNETILQWLQGFIFMPPMWFPLIMLFIYKYHIRRKTKYALFTGLLIGINLLINQPQISYYLFLLLSLISMFFIYEIYKTDRKNMISYLKGLILIPLVAFGLSAIQIVPVFNFMSQNSRIASYGFSITSYFTAFHKYFINFVFPIHWDNNANEIEVFMNNTYIGIFPLIFFVFGITFVKHKLKRIFICLTIFIFLVFFKSYFFGNDLLYLFLPGFGSMRMHQRIIIFLPFFLSTIASWGFQNIPYIIKEFNHKYNKYIFPICSVILTTFLFYLLFGNPISENRIFNASGRIIFNDLDQKWYLWFLLTIFFILFVLLHKRINLNKNINSLLLIVIVITFCDLINIHNQNKSIDVYGSGGYCVIAPTSNLQGVNLIYYRDIFITQPNPPIIKPLSERLKYRTSGKLTNTDLFSKEFSCDGIVPVTSKYYINTATTGGFIHPVRYMEFGMPTGNKNYDFFKHIKEGPRVQLLQNYITAANDEEALSILRNFHSFNDTVILTGKNDYNHIEIDNKNKQIGTADIIQLTNNRVLFEVKSDVKNAFLVYYDSWHPYWHAYLDKKEVPIIKANYMFKAIEIPQGNHSLELSFKPLDFFIGTSITIITVLLFLILGFFALYKHFKYEKKYI